MKQKQKEGDFVKEKEEVADKEKLCLVTGACGFCGSWMVDVLYQKGYKVRATDIESTSRKFLNPNVEFIPSDLTDRGTLKDILKGVNIIFHPAAIFSYSAPLDDLRRVNVEGTRNLLEEAIRAKVEKIIVWSTAGVYDVSKPYKEPLTEDGPLGASNNYELSKLEQEQIAMEYQRKGDIKVTIVRPAPIYGPRNFYGASNIIFGISKIPVIPVPYTLKNRAVSVHVADVVNGALYLAENPNSDGEIYNLVDDSSYTYGELVAYVAASLGKPIIPVFIPINKKIFAGGALILAKLTRSLAKRGVELGPLKYLEEDTANYVKYSFAFSNKKLKKTGYKFLYPDPKIGFVETIKWYKDNGYL